MLAVLEAIARHQPIGVSALARLLDADKSAVQRAIMTLADDKWIRPAAAPPTRWEMTHHILSVAYMGLSMGQGDDDLRQRARRTLELLRDESGESSFLAVPEIQDFVIVETIDSRQMLRATLNVGLIIPAATSATGRCVLPYFSPVRQVELLGGGEAGPELLEHFRASLERGYSISNEVVIDGVVHEGSTTLASPIFDGAGRPVGTVAITGPTERLTAARQAVVGPMVAAAAQALSRGTPHTVHDG